MGREDDDGHHGSKRRKHSHESDRGVKRRDDKLSFNAQRLNKDDMDKFQGVFAKYLKDRKDINIDEISSSEAYGRFKAFVHKWNEGELSSKYYDPELRRRLDSDAKHERKSSHDHKDKSSEGSRSREHGVYPRLDDVIVGPTLPSREDLQLQKEQLVEDAEKASQMHSLERKAARRLEKEQLNDLIPRADPGTKERRLEKKAEVSAAHRAFREKSPEVTVPERELMGGDDIKADLLRQKRIEAERQARRDEAYRLREAEKIQRRTELEKREDGTMEMLKRLAQERYGAGL